MVVSKRLQFVFLWWGCVHSRIYVCVEARLRPTGDTTLPLDRPERAAAQQLQLVTEASRDGVFLANWTCMTRKRSHGIRHCIEDDI